MSVQIGVFQRRVNLVYIVTPAILHDDEYYGARKTDNERVASDSLTAAARLCGCDHLEAWTTAVDTRKLDWTRSKTSLA